MRFRHSLLILILATAGCATTAPVRAPSILPLRSLRLYEAGVGYFERAGTLGGTAVTTLPVPSGHLDDALTSLVILNGGAGGLVTGLSYGSSVSQGVARARAGLPVDSAHPLTYRDVLLSLKGERVEVTVGGDIVVGRLIEVLEEAEVPEPLAKADSKPPDNAPPKPKEPSLVLLRLTGSGELVREKGPTSKRCARWTPPLPTVSTARSMPSPREVLRSIVRCRCLGMPRAPSPSATLPRAPSGARPTAY